jgi:hypothetical protein
MAMKPRFHSGWASCGIGLALGYALLGAGWFALKSEGALRDWAWRRIPWLAGAVLVVLGLAAAAAFIERARMTGSLYIGRPWWLGPSCHWPIGHVRGLRGSPPTARRLAVRSDRGLLGGGASLARGDVLALHDLLHDHCRQCGGAGQVALLPVLGRRAVRIARDRDLHRSRLLAVPGTLRKRYG